MLFGTLRIGDDALRDEIFSALRALVGCVKAHMRRFLPDLLALIHEYWPSAPRLCLTLMADLGMALKDDFRFVRTLDSALSSQPLTVVALCLGAQGAGSHGVCFGR